MKYYKKTILPEESLVQTILVNSGKFNLFSHHKIYDDYSKCASINGSPKTLTIEDYPKIITGEFFFARKFEQDSEVLDMLDAIIFCNQQVIKY
ncbi:hypothetical protein CAL7716_044490 [Calothrix sp. PCC 7716]|nr:hypothetical protein CAL7716_044490 [Calothrix sp. PCC 7716]